MDALFDHSLVIDFQCLDCVVVQRAVYALRVLIAHTNIFNAQ
jgi:hypothetical protein